MKFLMGKWRDSRVARAYSHDRVRTNKEVHDLSAEVGDIADRLRIMQDGVVPLDKDNVDVCRRRLTTVSARLMGIYNRGIYAPKGLE